MKATHDSLTSYPLKNWSLYPFLWVARTQTKTIEQQLDCGVRYFDLRFVEYKGNYYAAHGLCVFDITIEDVFEKINKWCNENEQDVYFRVLYERECTDIKFAAFKHRVDMSIIYGSKFLKLHCIGQKDKWNAISYKIDVPYYGDNAFTLATIDAKIEEMQFGGKMEEPYIYECYSYKMIFPRFSNWLIKNWIPNNSMRNFV